MFNKTNQPINDDAYDLINSLKDMNPDSRPTAEAALCHRYLANSTPTKKARAGRRSSPKNNNQQQPPSPKIKQQKGLSYWPTQLMQEVYRVCSAAFKFPYCNTDDSHL